MNIQFYKIFKIINRNAISRWLYRTPLWRTCREQVLLDSEAEACGSMRRRTQVSLWRLLLRLQEGTSLNCERSEYSEKSNMKPVNDVTNF